MINSSSGSAGSGNGNFEAEEDDRRTAVVKSFSEALKPIEEQQRLTNERLAKLQHSVEVMSYQQREQVRWELARSFVILFRYFNPDLDPFYRICIFRFNSIWSPSLRCQHRVQFVSLPFSATPPTPS